MICLIATSIKMKFFNYHYIRPKMFLPLKPMVFYRCCFPRNPQHTTLLFSNAFILFTFLRKNTLFSSPIYFLRKTSPCPVGVKAKGLWG